MFNMKNETFMRKLDSLCFERVLERDGHKCIICELIGKTPKSPLQPMHVWSRQFKNIRWCLWNIYPGCGNHHVYGVHSNKTLTEDLLKAIIAAKYPDRWEFIVRERGIFLMSICRT